jgi:hypothetical protein
LDLNSFYPEHLQPEAVFKEKHGVMRPYAGACYTSPYLIDDSEDKPSNPTLTNAEECFPNYSNWKNQSEKVEYKGRG